MTTWATFREAVRQAVAAASGLADAAVVWGNAGQPVADPVVRLFVTSGVRETNVREVLAEPTPGADLSREVCVIRLPVVQIRVESCNVAVGSDALETLGEIELGLHSQAAQAILEAAGVVYVRELGSSRDHTFRSGDRAVAARSFDARFRAVFSKTDPTSVGVIERAEVSGETSNPTVVVPEETIPEE